MSNLNVMYASDENYAPFLGVSVFSLLENNKDIENITVYAVLDGVSQENHDRLTSMVKSYGRDIVISDSAVFNQTFEELGVPKYRGSYAANFRQLFHLIIKDDVERLLYLDADTIVAGSLKELTDLDLDGACAGVIRDALGSRYKSLVGFKPEELYFNSGVMLFDVNKWKQEKCTEILIDHIKNVRSRYCNPDQDLFNVALKGKFKVIPCEYNCMPVHRAYSDRAFDKCYGFSDYYSLEEIENARRNPKIVHMYRFLGEFPWHTNNMHPDTALFDMYLEKSPWKDYIKKPANTGFVTKTEKILYRILPDTTFLKIFSRVMQYSFKRKNDKLIKN